jgi:hypothetical protein
VHKDLHPQIIFTTPWRNWRSKPSFTLSQSAELREQQVGFGVEQFSLRLFSTRRVSWGSLGAGFYEPRETNCSWRFNLNKLQPNANPLVNRPDCSRRKLIAESQVNCPWLPGKALFILCCALHFQRRHKIKLKSACIYTI